MAPSIEGTGKIIERMGKDAFGIRMAISLKAILLMISRMEWELTSAKMGQSTPVCGWTISNTARVRQFGQTAPNS